MALKTIIKPWGKFIQFTLNEPTTVKLIIVNPGEELSLQTHQKRKEFWFIVAGKPIITVGETITEANVGDEFTVPQATQHRIKAQDKTVQFLEISYGQFDEEDIVRLEDNYGRAHN
jgi:mannose-6-phosphate isomerase-like protein (cupin superfamily)